MTAADEPPVLSVLEWGTNARLIADVARLGHIDIATDDVLDVTYGRGAFWTVVRPRRIATHDIRLDGVDFRDLPEADSSKDVIVFDPPYVPQGGKADNSVDEFRDRYGLDDVPGNTADLINLILAGLAEVTRVVRPGGVILMKCQPFRNGGELVHMPYIVTSAGEGMGLRLIDEFVMKRAPGRVSRTKFNRSRQNRSHLLVLRKQHRPSSIQRYADYDRSR